MSSQARVHPAAIAAYIATVWAVLAVLLHHDGGTWLKATGSGFLMAWPVGAGLILAAMIVVAPFGIIGVAVMTARDSRADARHRKQHRSS